jgi:phenylalanine-4-hydroxylase
MRTDYRIDDFQQSYFVVDSLDQLLEVTLNSDFAPLYAANAARPPIAVDALVAGDEVITRGTQEYALGRG